MKDKDKKEVLTGNTGEQETANNGSDTDVVQEENIPVVHIDTTTRQDEQQ